MSNIIAVAGKGGTGKTTIASIIIRVLKEAESGPTLAIDADPNSNLGEMLGIKDISTIVEIIDDISRNPGQIPAGMTKDRFIGLKVQESLNEEDGFDLLSMGRPEGPGCYCFINNMLRELMTKLMKSYSNIVIDNEAGMEHLSRRVVRSIDELFIVSDASVIGIRSAGRISRLQDELKIKVKNRYLVLNKSRGSVSLLKDEIKETGLDLKAVLPLDKALEDNAVKNKSVFDLKKNNPALDPIRELLTHLAAPMPRPLKWGQKASFKR